MIRHVLTLGMALVLTLGCGRDEANDEETAPETTTGTTTSGQGSSSSPVATTKLQFSRSLALASVSAPDSFKMKLISAYLTEDLDESGANIGDTHLIWLNDDCQEDIRDCDISAGTNDDGEPFGNIVTSYFDFSDPTAVNEVLNAQSRELVLWVGPDDAEVPENPSKTYRYVRLEFCKYNTGESENVIWETVATGERSYTRNHCVANSAKFASDLIIEEGQEVTVSLTYDLSETVQTGADADGDDCTADGPDKTCFSLPNFQPSADLN